MDNREAADVLAYLQHSFGYSGAEMAARSGELGQEYALNPSFIANVRHKGIVPNLRHLYAISEVFHLTLGSTFSLFGFDLDALALTDLRLNQERTRLIEHYPFGPGKSWLPSALGPAFDSEETAFLHQLVHHWQHVAHERVWGADWQESRCLYGKLGIYDSYASPDIPPGAYIQIVRMRERSLQELSPTALYFIQHPHGYTACRCGIEKETLLLYSSNPSFPAPRRWKLRSEGRILGMITAFAASLPTESYHRPESTLKRRTEAVALAPWEHTSLPGLFQTNCQRFGLSREDIDRFNAKLLEIHGIHISGKYARTLHRTSRSPQTASALAMAVTASLRLRDVFRSCGFSVDDRHKFQLSDLLAPGCYPLPPGMPPPIPPPQPHGLWATFLKNWKEWPFLLRRGLLKPDGLEYQVLRLNQNHAFHGLDVFLKPGSILRIDPKPVSWGAINSDVAASDWARRLYVIEYGRNSPSLLGGYLVVDGSNVILAPHPAARSTHSLTFRRSEIHVLGTVTGIMARMA
jgi:hypothetical protein